ncbi:MAG: hypothetical protein OEY59_02300 [Deltaproteobacteria bacterium]|nr:hypothetical protein [Deltaproteobacteria bacterium]
MINNISDNIWIIPYQTKSMGVLFKNKSTVIRINGELLIISPGPWDEYLKTELEKLGALRWIFAPNSFHHLHYRSWLRASPELEAWGTKALAKKRPEIKFNHIWDGEQPFEPEVQLFGLMGIPKIDEILFYHKSSGSLIVTDLIFNELNLTGPMNWFFYSLFGIWKRTATSRLFKMCVSDKKAFKTSLESIFDLNIEQVILNHGNTLDNKTDLVQTLTWI